MISHLIIWLNVSWNKGLKKVFVFNKLSPFKNHHPFFPPSLDFHVWSLRLDQFRTPNGASFSCLVGHGNVFEKKFPVNMILPWTSSSLNLQKQMEKSANVQHLLWLTVNVLNSPRKKKKKNIHHNTLTYKKMYISYFSSDFLSTQTC